MNRKTRLIFQRIGVIALFTILAIFINQQLSSPNVAVETNQNIEEGYVEVHFIDVGQGDSILIETAEASMLIDAGENNMGTTVVDYIKSHGIKELEYVIGTHPHSDHIGGLDYVINSIPVENIIMPDVVHTSKAFEDLLDAIKKNSLKITKPVVGDKYQLGPAEFMIVSPNSDEYDTLNNYSVGIKLTYGKNSFLLLGDAEKESEREMLTNGIDLSSDVLKLSHHGANTSSTSEFLDAVDPQSVIISVGENNSYGHPHKDVLQTLLDRNIKIYRTDKQGTIVLSTDGKNIITNTAPYKITDNDLK